MTTKHEVREQALALARAGSSTDAAVRELLACCGDKRVSVVLARREILDGDDEGTDATSQLAGEFLDEVLQRLPE